MNYVIHTDFPETDLNPTAFSYSVKGFDLFEGSLSVQGAVRAGDFIAASDERLKTFGNPVSVDLDALSKLRKSYFVFNDRTADNCIGVSAQELRTLYPEIVKKDMRGYLGVDYSKLSVVALAAIDKLHERIKVLEDTILKLTENK